MCIFNYIIHINATFSGFIGQSNIVGLLKEFYDLYQNPRKLSQFLNKLLQIEADYKKRARHLMINCTTKGQLHL